MSQSKVTLTKRQAASLLRDAADDLVHVYAFGTYRVECQKLGAKVLRQKARELEHGGSL